METRKPSNRLSLCGAVAVVCGMTATPSCLNVNKDLPGVIAVPGESVPHFMREGERAEFEGWLLPTPLFNEALPGIRDALEQPRDVYPALPDDGWEPNDARPGAEQER